MGARFFSGPGRVPGFQLHSEAANRGGLTTFLAMPETDAATLDGVLSTLRDPSARADLDASLGRLAASLPPGSGFLVGSGDEVWVFPSPRIRFHRVLGEVDNRIRDPEVVRLKPRERVEIWGEGDEEFLGELYLELPPVGADEAAPQPADGPRIPRPIWRRPSVSFPVALAVAGAAAWFAIEWREGRTTARIDAYVSGNLEDRVVELVGRTSRDEVASPGTPPDGIANDGVDGVDALEGAPAATPAAPAADVAAVTGWEFRASGAITSSPAFAEGRVVFGSRDSLLYCLDAATGERAWTAPVGSGVGSSPCVVDGTCYVGTYGGRLVACDLATGKIRWSQSTRGRIVSSPCVVGPNVIVGSYDRAVHALDRETGDKRWRFTTQGIVRASPHPTGPPSYPAVRVTPARLPREGPARTFDRTSVARRSWCDRDCVPRFIQHHFDVTWQAEHDRDPVTLVDWVAFHVDAFRPQVADRAGDVVAHERELVASARFVGGAFRRMHAELRRRQREYQPAVPGIDVRPAEYVAQHRAKFLRLRGIEQRVSSYDRHDASSLRGAPPHTPAELLAGTPAPRAAPSSFDDAQDDPELVEGSQARRARLAT